MIKLMTEEELKKERSRLLSGGRWWQIEAIDYILELRHKIAFLESRVDQLIVVDEEFNRMKRLVKSVGDKYKYDRRNKTTVGEVLRSETVRTHEDRRDGETRTEERTH